MFNLIFFLLILISFAYILETIPPAGSPPEIFYSSGIVYDPISDSLILFGGNNEITSSFTNTLIRFSLSTLKWSIINPETSYTPIPISDPILYLRSDRILFCLFGMASNAYLSDINVFNLTSNSWSLLNYEKKISGRSESAYDSFIWNNTEYLAIYGGYTSSGAKTDLYL